VSSSVEPLFVPLTLFAALTLAGALVAGLRWLLSPSAGLPWPLSPWLGLLALDSVAWAYVFAQGDEDRVFPGRLAAAVLVAGVGLLAVAVAVRRRGRISRGG
jgi:energy-converting hydrogenase Eha subunit G